MNEFLAFWLVLSLLVTVACLGMVSESADWKSEGVAKKILGICLVFVFWPVYITYGMGKGIAQAYEENRRAAARFEKMQAEMNKGRHLQGSLKGSKKIDD